MSQTTNDQNDSGYAWARRPDHQEPTAPIQQPIQPPSQQPYLSPASDSRPREDLGDAPSASLFSDTYPSAPSAHPADPTPVADVGGGGALPPEPAQSLRREPRRPGWGGVVAVGVGSAVLASLLTGGIISATQNNDSSGGTTTGISSGAAVKAPVTSSSASLPDWGKVAAAVEPSVVSVQVTSSTEEGEGSGVILDKTGRIVTNNHVATGAGSGATLKVVLNDGRGYAATIVGTDPDTDLAVIKITNPPSDLTPAVFGSSSGVAVGDPVMAVGNPLGLAGTVTTGIVSATDRLVTTQAEDTTPSQSQSQDPFGGLGESGSGSGSQSNSTTSDDEVATNAIQTDAAINPGNSGGALVDAQGRVIGIPSSIASLNDTSAFGSSSQSGSIGLGFAIPVDEVNYVTSQLIKGGTVAHSWLGVSVADASVTINGASLDAAQLKSVNSGAPGAKAGLRTGDYVIAVDGVTVNSSDSLIASLRERSPNSVVTLSVVRGGKVIPVKVTLGTRPASAN